MKIKAKIMNINYKDIKTNYCILKINIKSNSNKQCKLKNTTLKGTITTTVANGDIIECECEYNSKENNLIFKEMYEQDKNENDRLANFFVDHTEKISKNTFIKILSENTIDEIIKDNSILDKHKLSKKKKNDIVKVFEEYKKIEYINHIMTLSGATTEQAYAIYNLYELASVSIIEKNPFKLYFDDILTWKQVEDLASFFSVPDETRNKALVQKQIFDYCYNSGNVCIPESQIELTDTLNELISDNRLVRYKDFIYTNRLYAAERKLEKSIQDIINNSGQQNDGIVSSTQEEAVFNALNFRISILTGGPGTGKTHTINKIVKEIEHKGTSNSYCLLAPTGKASDRLAELTNRSAETIHRKLNLLPFSNYLTDEEISEDYVIIDECSMLDLELSACLFSHISEHTKIVLVGDVNQLPSVGPGRVFQDLIESGLIKTTKLTKVFRQAQNSKIVQNAYAVLNGTDLDYTPSSDFEFIETTDIDKIQDYIKKNYNNKTQILTSQHESQLGTDILNLIIQDKDERGFYELDKVIQSTNNYDLGVFNGNIGKVTDVYEKLVNGEWQNIVTVDFENIGKVIEYDKKNISEIELAYALTIHKSQGSEFPVVIIPIHKHLEYMLNKNLLYTAFTRAKKKLILIGDKQVLEEARHKEIIRKSNLF